MTSNALEPKPLPVDEVLLDQVENLLNEDRHDEAMEVTKKIKDKLYKLTTYSLISRSCAKADKLDLAITAFQPLCKMEVNGPFYNEPLHAIFKKVKKYNEQNKNITTELSPMNRDFLVILSKENNKVWDNLDL